MTRRSAASTSPEVARLSSPVVGDDTSSGAVGTAVRSAVYLSPGRIDVEYLEAEDPGPTDAVVTVDHCGICGTDLHLFVDGWGRPGSVGGHEYSGVVAAVGTEVRDLSSGDRVVHRPARSCGTCRFCVAGRSSLCEARDAPLADSRRGAFAASVTVPASQLVPVPAGLSLRTAALAEPLAVALHGIARSGAEDGDRAFVSGCGPIGALITAVLVVRGHEVRVSEPAPARRDLAHRLGATVVTPADLDVPSTAEPGRLVSDAAQVAFECSGRPDAVAAALAQLDRAGTLVVLGTGMERPAFDTNRILLNELVVTGAYNDDPDGIVTALQLLASGTLPVDELIEPVDVALDGIEAAVAALASGRIAGKVLVAPATTREPGATR